MQRFLTTKVENFLEKKIKTKVEIGTIRFGLSGKVSLSDVYFEDQTKDTLLWGGTIKARINYLKLFRNEVIVKDIEINNVTAKIKRILPDTVFNFQYIIDALTGPSSKDTSAITPLNLSINKITLENVNVFFSDVITGNEMFVKVGNMVATIDSFNVAAQKYNIPGFSLQNTTARIKQYKPMLSLEPVVKDMAEALTPFPFQLDVGIIDLSNIDVDYANDISAFYTTFDIGKLKADVRLLDLQNKKIHLDEFILNNSTSIIRLGKTLQAKVVEKEIKQEVEAQKQAGWDFKIDKVQIDNNTFQFDNDNSPALRYGMDYAHLKADSFHLNVNNFVMNPDSTGGKITRGSFHEKSGFDLDELRGDLLYSYNEAYLKDLFIKTPGTEIKRYALLKYDSYEALIKNPDRTLMNLELVNSRVQVKDILIFAPQLRSHPALRNPNDIWRLNIVGNGNMARLNFETLQFEGLQNTRINAKGTLEGLINPDETGGTFTIYNLHTTKSDLSLFTGNALSKMKINLPQSFDINGTIAGNMNNLKTALNVNTSSGFIGVNGKFTNLANPVTATYTANIWTKNFQAGRIFEQPGVGAISANIYAKGKGFTPSSFNTTFTGDVGSLGYNNYTYHNIDIKGSLIKTVFDIDLKSRDPNAYLTANVSGIMSDNASIKIDAFVDSLKTFPLHFTTEPMVFRGKIQGDIPNINPDNLEADVWITNALFVAGKDRLPLDTVHFISGRNDTAQVMRLTSDIISAEIIGQYRLADLGLIIQHNTQPYFSVTPNAALKSVKPYDFRFSADVLYSPVLSAFVPGFIAAEPIHAAGRLATNEGLSATVYTPFINFNKNQINNLNLRVNTTDSGMVINGTIAHLVNGTLDVYNVDLAATALNNKINFNLAIDDKNGNDKYNLAGLLTQPSTGDFTIQLNPANFLLNYERWTISPGNSISMINNEILASNFQLQKGEQQLTLQSTAGAGSPLNVQFSNFKIGTITGFLRSDSLLVDGTTNGNVRLENIMTLPVFTSNLTIADLSFRKDTMGNLTVQVASSGNRYTTNATLSGRGNDLNVTGSFAPQGKSDMALDLNLAILKIEMSTLEGALKEFVKSASGSINGNVSIRGTASKPDINGKINFDSTSISTIMLGGPLTINNESLNVTNDGFIFDNFAIKDSANHTLVINGPVLTSNFINYDFDLRVTSENFRVLNTTKKDNKIYYGQLFISTDLTVKGTEKAPVMDGSVIVVDGTDLSVVIPQPEPGVADREGIVEFVDFDSPENDTLFRQYDSLNVSSLIGFDIQTNLEIKKEAKFNIIVDAANGDFINLQGEALLTAGIDPSGKITLTGPFEIEQGAYQLTFNFLQRKFDIQKGSKIVWLGEPTNAELNVTAVYEANISSLDLVADQIPSAQRNYYLQKLPFQVTLNLTGEIMKPQIAFDINLPENRNYTVSGEVESTVRSRLALLRREPSEINKQVFAVLLLGRFIGDNPFQSEGGGGFDAKTFAKQSVSKLLTEQLNNLATGLIDGVDINFDVASGDDYSTGEKRTRTDLNVGVSKQLLNDRLTVTVGSNFQLEGKQPAGNQGSNNIAGNVSVNYQLSRDGRFMLRFYRKNDYEGLVDGYVVETGIGFLISVDYDRFRDILRERKIKREERRKAKQPKEQNHEGNQQP